MKQSFGRVVSPPSPAGTPPEPGGEQFFLAAGAHTSTIIYLRTSRRLTYSDPATQAPRNHGVLLRMTVVVREKDRIHSWMKILNSEEYSRRISLLEVENEVVNKSSTGF